MSTFIFRINMFKLILFFKFVAYALSAEVRDFPDPYPGVYSSMELLPPFLHGWYRHEQIKDIIATHSIKAVVEVGVWTGNFAVYLASMLEEGSKYYAVDHWKGSVEHQSAGCYESTLLPTLYQQFLSNMVHYNLVDKVIPVRMSSVDAAAKFKELGIKADLIYIDSSHDYKSVIDDLEAWYPVLNEGGVLCGDDWNLGNLSVAVKDFASRNNLTVHHEGEFWYYSKR